ncbi:hypothetical protein [Nocardia xishanensis]|uniref:Uncharacterized protein n=1 Tax=Nocardia xishanensis TaxID=238964 RepID=A0ABW7XCB0_9NOCA
MPVKDAAGVSTSPEAVLTQLSDYLKAGFAQIELAEAEIERAQARYPVKRNALYHSFSLLKPTHERMAQLFVYRSHCRELLDRVAAGECTKPGTAAEVAIAMLVTSRRVPLNTSGFGLYARMWATAGFPPVQGLTESAAPYEAIASTRIDEREQWMRRKLAVADRVLTDIVCPGRHHGEPVNCEFFRSGADLVA